jgi:DNA topoisomerase-3
MIAFATALAARKGVRLPRGLKTSAAVCRGFLDAHAERREAPPPGETRPPTPAMLRFAQALAREKALDGLPPEVEIDHAACRRFLDAHAARSTGSEPRAKPVDRSRGKRGSDGTAAPRRTRRPRAVRRTADAGSVPP